MRSKNPLQPVRRATLAGRVGVGLRQHNPNNVNGALYFEKGIRIPLFISNPQ